MRLALLTVLALAAATAANASSFASSAADAGSSASGSVSDSFKASSNSSGGGGARFAEGRYRVTEVAKADAGKLTLKMAREGAEPVELTLPQQAMAARAVNVGDEVQATPQPYGIAFAHADTGQAFFLVLEDTWHRELAAHVVKP